VIGNKSYEMNNREDLLNMLAEHIDALARHRMKPRSVISATLKQLRTRVREYDRLAESILVTMRDAHTHLMKERRTEREFNSSLKSMRQAMATAMNIAEDKLPGFEAIVYSLCAETSMLREQRDSLRKREGVWNAQEFAIRKKLERILDERKQKHSISELIDRLELDLNCEHERAVMAESTPDPHELRRVGRVWASGGKGNASRVPSPNSIYSDGMYLGECGPAMACAHANEVPQACSCPQLCYCRAHTCKATPIHKV
jgi:hypothetical protein